MGFAEFKAKVIADKEFAAKVKALKSLDEAVAFGKEHGYTFTADEVKANGKLSDDELEAVAGGTTVMAKTYFVTK